MTPRQARARLARAKRYDPNGDHTALERDLHVANVEKAAQKVADSLPPLTAQQRARIGALLIPALAGLDAEAADAGAA